MKKTIFLFATAILMVACSNTEEVTENSVIDTTVVVPADTSVVDTNVVTLDAVDEVVE
jgi:uncharacterized protein YcfL